MKLKDVKIWVLIALALVGIFYNVVSNYTIQRNDLKHFQLTLEKIERRLDRIEEVLWQK